VRLEIILLERIRNKLRFSCLEETVYDKYRQSVFLIDNHILFLKRFLQRILLQIGTNDAYFSGINRGSCTNFRFFRNKVKIVPGSFFVRQHSLGPENLSIFLCMGQILKDSLQLLPGNFPAGFKAPAGKYLICIVTMVMVMM